MKQNTLSSREQAETAKAKVLHERLAQVNPLDLPLMTRDRSMQRKDQAKLARELFKQLGFKGISVTTPNYSMASTVSVKPPARYDYVLDEGGFIVRGDGAAKANTDAYSRILSILLAAFPNHDDRSETQSDHFDFKWSVG